ncbi:MAG: dUTP diphosphatase [Eggerthellaceae bacterium]|nr:dUTP diphosphatase [Eggerthellaceae bacterium]
MIEIPIKVLDEGIPVPEYAHAGDAGLDLRCTEDFTLEPFQRAAIPTGIAVELPEGYAALVLPRSGLAIRHGISLVNAPGLIDSNYRGEIKAILVNLDPDRAFSARRGERIAQLLVLGVEEVRLVAKAELAESIRGEAGFGSSGTA